AAREEVRIHALAVVRAAHLQQLEGAVEGASDRVILEMDRAIGQVDRQEHVLPDRLAGLGMLFDRAEHDAEFLEGVEQFPDLLRRLFEGHVQGLFALLDAFHQELTREGRLPRPARPQDDHGRLRPEAAFDQVVEPWDSARYFLDIRHGMIPLGPRPARRGEGLAGWNMALDAGGFLKPFRPRNLP